jgi:CHAT domain-containing protein
MTVATAFLAAGAAGVVGSRWDVSGRLTPPFMFMFHHYLVAEGMPPADALRAAQLWMLDPGRALPEGFPPVFAGDIRGQDLTDVAVWAAFGHHGR